MQKKEITNNDLIVAIEKLDRKITGVSQEMQGEFKSVRQEIQTGFKEVREEITDLAQTTGESFSHIERRLENMEIGHDWMRDMMEKQATTLLRLDQERLFTINHVNRLENEINEIKAQLKIS